MKKIFAIVVCIVTMLPLCSCAKKSEPINLNRLYSVDAEVQFASFSANIGLNRLGNGVWDINFTKPENLNGLSVSYENEMAKISYKGLSFSLAKEDVPVNALVSSIAKVLDNAALGKEMSFTKKNNEIIAKGEIDNMEYIITLDSKTGVILELQLPKSDLKVNFSGYKPMS